MKICGEVIETREKTAMVKTSRPQSCKGCSNAGLCNKKELVIQAVNSVGAQKGDCVEVEMPEDGKAILLLCYIFLVPVLILLFCIWLYTIQNFLAFAAVPLAGIYFLILKRINKTHRSTNRILSVQRGRADDEN